VSISIAWCIDCLNYFPSTQLHPLIIIIRQEAITEIYILHTLLSIWSLICGPALACGEVPLGVKLKDLIRNTYCLTRLCDVLCIGHHKLSEQLQNLTVPILLTSEMWDVYKMTEYILKSLYVYSIRFPFSALR
jgi:hypothetical protein